MKTILFFIFALTAATGVAQQVIEANPTQVAAGTQGAPYYVSPRGLAGFGTVSGPGSSTDNAIARFNGTTGKVLQNSGVVVDDTAANNTTIGGVDANTDVTIRGGLAGATALFGRAATGAITFTAAGTNQNITLTPSGTGSLVFGNGSSAVLTNANSSADLVIRGKLFVQIQTNNFSGTPSAYFHSDGSVFIKKATTSSNGDLQIASTSATTGLALGTRAAEVIYRPGTNDTLRTDSHWIINQATAGSAVTTLQSTATNDDPAEIVYQNRVATTDATVTTLHTFTIPASTTYMVEVRVTARRTGGTAGTTEDGAGYSRVATIKNAAGTATIIGAVATPWTMEDQAGWDCTIDVTGATARVRVTGAVDNNVTWHMTARVYAVGS